MLMTKLESKDRRLTGCRLTARWLQSVPGWGRAEGLKWGVFLWSFAFYRDTSMIYLHGNNYLHYHLQLQLGNQCRRHPWKIVQGSGYTCCDIGKRRGCVMWMGCRQDAATAWHQPLPVHSRCYFASGGFHPKVASRGWGILHGLGLGMMGAKGKQWWWWSDRGHPPLIWGGPGGWGPPGSWVS